MKIRKFITAFLGKSMEDIKPNYFLQFISSKHKIPIEVINKTPKTQVGYVRSVFMQKETDIRKIGKYQVNIQNLPPLGINFDSETKTQEQGDDMEVKPLIDTADILHEEVNCFEQRPED